MLARQWKGALGSAGGRAGVKAVAIIAEYDGVEEQGSLYGK